MEDLEKKQNNIINIPRILTITTFFWKSGYSNKVRKYHERKINEIVSKFFESIGFDTEAEGVFISKDKKIKCEFSYYESCSRIYKTFKVYDDNGNKKDIRYLKEYLISKGWIIN